MSNWYNFVKNEQFPDHQMGNCHNPKCSVDSNSCSIAMSVKYPDLCFWHSVRMGSKYIIECGCRKQITAVDGDSIGRVLVRNYFKLPYETTAVFCIGRLYCCGSCSNQDSEEYTCGDMLVGPCCKHLHSKLCQIETEDTSE